MIPVLAELVLALAPAAAWAGASTPEDDTLLVGVGRVETFGTPWSIAGVSLTDPAIADVDVLTSQLLVVTGLAPGSTDLLLWNDDGEVHAVRVEVQVDLERLRAELADLFPESTLELARAQSLTFVSGTLTTVDQTAQLRAYLDQTGVHYVDSIRVAGLQQVQVQVRLAEVSRTGLRALGVNGFAVNDDAFLGSTIGSAAGGPINPFSIGPRGGFRATGEQPFIYNTNPKTSPAVTIFGGLHANLEVFVQALQENQYMRILAEPNLIAMSGETASFLAGGEFPVPVVQGANVGAATGSSVTVEFKPFGISLRFRPTVLGDGGVRIEVSSEVSDLSEAGAVQANGFHIPSIMTRRAETTLEMKSGQTFAMAGLLNESTAAVSSEIPGLGSLPILGSLFRSVRYQRGETELVLLVTTALVDPMSDTVLPPLPGTTHVVPSDWELYSKGQIEGGPPPRIAPEGREWLARRGLDRLRGPGAWATHDQGPARSTAPEPEREPEAPPEPKAGE